MEEKNALQKTEAPLMNIISLATADGSVDADKLMKLLEANRQWEADQARKAYIAAMAAFQSEAPKIIKDTKGHNSGYAKLPTVISVVSPVESKNGLSHSWTTKCKDKEIEVTCKITHVQGHCEETCLSAGADTTGSKNSVQALGSTITYLKRYTLEAALGLAEEDDDGNGEGKPAPEVAQLTAENVAALDAIEGELVLNDKFPDMKKVAAIFWSEKGAYPKDATKAEQAAAFILTKDSSRWEVKREEN